MQKQNNLTQNPHKNLTTNINQTSKTTDFAKQKTFPFAKAGALLIVTGAVTYFTLQHIFISGGLITIGLIFFATHALIRKSVELTSQTAQSLYPTSALGQLESTRRQIAKTKYYEQLEQEGEALTNQAEILINQYKTLNKMIGQKFDIGELTFSRYQEAVEKACLSIGENLLFLKNILDQLNITRANRLTEPVSQDKLVDENNLPSPVTGKPLNWESQRQDFLKGITKSNEALSQLTQLFQALNNIVTQEQHQSQLEDYLEQLKQLSERSKLYNKDS